MFRGVSIISRNKSSLLYIFIIEKYVYISINKIPYLIKSNFQPLRYSQFYSCLNLAVLLLYLPTKSTSDFFKQNTNQLIFFFAKSHFPTLLISTCPARSSLLHWLTQVEESKRSFGRDGIVLLASLNRFSSTMGDHWMFSFISLA